MSIIAEVASTDGCQLVVIPGGRVGKDLEKIDSIGQDNGDNPIIYRGMGGNYLGRVKECGRL